MTLEKNPETPRPHFHMPVNLKVDSYPPPAPVPDTEMSAGAAVLVTLGVFAMAGLTVWAWWREKQNRERMRTLYARQEALQKHVQEIAKTQVDSPPRPGKIHAMER